MANQKSIDPTLKIKRLKSQYEKEKLKRDNAIAKMKEISEQIETEEMNQFKSLVKAKGISFSDALEALEVFSDNPDENKEVALEDEDDELV